MIGNRHQFPCAPTSLEGSWYAWILRTRRFRHTNCWTLIPSPNLISQGECLWDHLFPSTHRTQFSTRLIIYIVHFQMFTISPRVSGMVSVPSPLASFDPSFLAPVRSRFNLRWRIRLCRIMRSHTMMPHELPNVQWAGALLRRVGPAAGSKKESSSSPIANVGRVRWSQSKDHPSIDPPVKQ